jgi:hypothetical protein
MSDAKPPAEPTLEDALVDIRTLVPHSRAVARARELRGWRDVPAKRKVSIGERIKMKSPAEHGGLNANNGFEIAMGSIKRSRVNAA